MSDFIDLMRCIGSPLVNGGIPSGISASQRLLDLAFRNNVELLYMNKLKEAGLLGQMVSTFNDFENRREKTTDCLLRIVKMLDQDGIPYAITKSLRPYPAIPNDTDILYLGPCNGYEQAVARIERAGFRPSGGSRMQAQFFDPLGGENFKRDKRGGRFYIDFYRQLAADHVPYMDSAVLRNHVTSHIVRGIEVSVFEPIAEMTILFLHSVIMHRAFPLEVFASTAYWLAEMESRDLDRFAAFLKNNHALLVSASAFSLMSQIYSQAYSTIPEPILEMQARLARYPLGRWHQEHLTDQHPHICRLSTFIVALFEKIAEKNSFKGFCKQIFYMLNPVFLIEVMRHLLSRTRIKSHSAHV